MLTSVFYISAHITISNIMRPSRKRDRRISNQFQANSIQFNSIQFNSIQFNSMEMEMEMEWIKSIELIAMATGDGPFLNEIKFLLNWSN